MKKIRRLTTSEKEEWRSILLGTPVGDSISRLPEKFEWWWAQVDVQTTLQDWYTNWSNLGGVKSSGRKHRVKDVVEMERQESHFNQDEKKTISFYSKKFKDLIISELNPFMVVIEEEFGMHIIDGNKRTIALILSGFDGHMTFLFIETNLSLRMAN